MIRFCHVIKNHIFSGNGFKVFWSIRGRWTASTAAGALPGSGRGYVEATGETIPAALRSLDDLLESRRADLLEKIKEIDNALFYIRCDGYEAEALDGVAEKRIATDHKRTATKC